MNRKLVDDSLENADWPKRTPDTFAALGITPVTPAPAENMHGYCPHCDAPVVSRERRPGGNDQCASGHCYPSRLSRPKSLAGNRRKHLGPGDHPNGSPQSVHAGGGGGGGSGGKKPKPKPPKRGNISAVEAEGLASLMVRKGGFTYQPIDDNSPASGFAVSVFNDAETVIPDGNRTAEELTGDIFGYLQSHRDRFDDAKVHVGGWHDVDAKKIYLDLSVVETDREDAINAAKKHQQEAIFDLANFETIIVKEEHERRKTQSTGKVRVVMTRPNRNDDGALFLLAQSIAKGIKHLEAKSYLAAVKAKRQLKSLLQQRQERRKALITIDEVREAGQRAKSSATKSSATKDDCGANAEGGGGFQPGNTCAGGDGSTAGGSSAGSSGGAGASDSSGASENSDNGTIQERESRSEVQLYLAGIEAEPVTTVPDGEAYLPDVEHDGDGDGVTDASRVGIPAGHTPPPPPIPHLPNLTPDERKVETEFAHAFEADPDGMAEKFRQIAVQVGQGKGEPPAFGTDDAKVLSDKWSGENLTPEQRAANRAQYNVALHQTANAIAKRAFLAHLDTLKEGDEVLVTQGGCGCHAAGTPIMMADGSLKMVEEIEVGDQLMGPDSKPRNVLRLIRGRGKMHWVHPKKGKSFIVNEDHVLSLKSLRVRGGKNRTKLCTVNMTVAEVLARGSNFRRLTYLYRTGVDFPTQTVALDPYFLGLWLGDGSQHIAAITSADEEVAEYLGEFAETCPNTKLHVYKKIDNQASLYSLRMKEIGRTRGGEYRKNHVMSLLETVGVLNNKHIPECYLKNDRAVRLQVLAGLLDTDGYLARGYFEISTKLRRLADEIVFLARSLGFAAYVKHERKSSQTGFTGLYHRVSITGHIDEIPTRIKRKQAGPRKMNKDVRHVGFTLEEIGEGDYFGFSLDGDNLYLLDDFTVTHNSGKGFSLKNNPEALAAKQSAKAVWDSAGDQNATENPWIQAELEKRGLKGVYLFVHADPKVSWAHEKFGVVQRAHDPKDGRMVDASVFADSYALGAKNHKAFYDKHRGNPSARFLWLRNGSSELLDAMPDEATSIDREELYKFAVKTVGEKPSIAPRVKRGALVGARVWKKKRSK